MDSSTPPSPASGNASFIDYRPMEKAIGTASVDIVDLSLKSAEKLHRLNKSVPKISEELTRLNEAVFGAATANPQYNLVAASYSTMQQVIARCPIGPEEALVSENDPHGSSTLPPLDFRKLQYAIGRTSLRLDELDPDNVNKVNKLNATVAKMNEELAKLNEAAIAAAPATQAKVPDGSLPIAQQIEATAEAGSTDEAHKLFDTLNAIAAKKMMANDPSATQRNHASSAQALPKPSEIQLVTSVVDLGTQHHGNGESDRRYGSAKKLRATGMGLVVAGGICFLDFGILGTIFTTIAANAGFTSSHGIVFGVLGPIFLALAAFFACLLAKGIGSLSLASSFDTFKRLIGDRDSCTIDELSAKSSMSEKRVIAKAQKMMQRGLFPEGHLDDASTLLMLTDDAFLRHRQQAAEHVHAKTARSKRMPTNATENALPAEAQKFIQAGHDYIERMQALDIAIADEAVSDRIASISNIVDRLLNRVKDEPSTIDSLDKLMDYYLPTTVKFLEAYDDLEKEPAQGKNIASLRDEIENTLDILDEAYQKLLDESYQDTSLEVSSDISALNAVLAQEGLIRTPFDEAPRP